MLKLPGQLAAAYRAFRRNRDAPPAPIPERAGLRLSLKKTRPLTAQQVERLCSIAGVNPAKLMGGRPKDQQAEEEKRRAARYAGKLGALAQCFDDNPGLTIMELLTPEEEEAYAEEAASLLWGLFDLEMAKFGAAHADLNEWMGVDPDSVKRKRARAVPIRVDLADLPFHEYERIFLEAPFSEALIYLSARSHAADLRAVREAAQKALADLKK